MGYIEENLIDDEAVVHVVRLHPIVLLFPTMMVSLLAGSLAVSRDNAIVYGIVGLLLVFALFRLIDRLVMYLTSEFGVTTKRVLGKTGFIQRVCVEIVLAKVEAIRLNQTVMGRIFNFGELEITGTGGTEQVLQYIPDPIFFNKCIQEQLAESEEAIGRPEVGSRA